MSIDADSTCLEQLVHLAAREGWQVASDEDLSARPHAFGCDDGDRARLVRDSARHDRRLAADQERERYAPSFLPAFEAVLPWIPSRGWMYRRDHSVRQWTGRDGELSFPPVNAPFT